MSDGDVKRFREPEDAIEYPSGRAAHARAVPATARPFDEAGSPDPQVSADEQARMAEQARLVEQERIAEQERMTEQYVAEQAAADQKAAEEAEKAERLRQRSYQDPAEASGRSGAELIYWAALAVTAGADLAAFHQVVAIVLSTEQQWLVWLMVAGFTACSLTLAHFAGRLARDIVAGRGPASWRQFWSLAVPWVLLGLVAFLVRLIGVKATGYVGVGSSSADNARIAAAFMFLVLYVASGAVAGFGAYLSRNPVRAGYRRALVAHRQAMGRLEKSQPAYERAVQGYRQHARARERERLNYEAARDQRMAFADELKRYAAVLIAAHLQEPSKTEALTLPDRIPLVGTVGRADTAESREGDDVPALGTAPHSAAAIEAARAPEYVDAVEEPEPVTARPAEPSSGGTDTHHDGGNSYGPGHAPYASPRGQFGQPDEPYVPARDAYNAARDR